MDETATPLSDIKTISRRMVARALHLGENRLQLLLLEVEEERERLLHALILALGAAAFGLLAGVATGWLVTEYGEKRDKRSYVLAGCAAIAILSVVGAIAVAGGTGLFPNGTQI